MYSCRQWCNESEAAGEASRSMVPTAPPPPVTLFCLLVWDACHVVGTTCNAHCAIHLGGWGCYKPPSSSMVKSWWRSRGLALWKLQRICILRYLNLGLIFPTIRDGYAFFMCIVVQIHRKIPQVQNFQFSGFLSEKKWVCSIVLAG